MIFLDHAWKTYSDTHMLTAQWKIQLSHHHVVLAVDWQYIQFQVNSWKYELLLLYLLNAVRQHDKTWISVKERKSLKPF